MIDCPPFVLEYSRYTACFHFIFVISLVLNIYVIYCIVYRSTKEMSEYRWYLLLHQVAAFAVDVLLSTLVIPVVLLPLPAGFALGPFGRWFSSQHILMISYAITAIAMGTVCHLFNYRFVVAKGLNHFRRQDWFMISAGYLVTQSQLISIGMFYEDAPSIVEKLSQEYSCINSTFASMTGFIAYDPTIIQYLGYPSVLISCGQVFVCATFSFQTMKALNIPRMSAKLVRLQKKLLVHLILQISIPLLAIVIPLFLSVAICYFKIFGIPVVRYFFV